MKKLIAFILFFGAVAAIAYSVFLYKIKDMKPEDFVDKHEGMKKWMSESLIIQISKGLNVYKEKHGRYPITDSKYYLDSIIEFVEIEDVYIYHDTIIDGRVDCKLINSKTINTYIGVGNCNYPIKYSCSDGVSYNLHYAPSLQ